MIRQLPSLSIQPLSPYAKTIAFLLGFGVLFLGYCDSVRRQWDFPVYYLASAALWDGENPYDPDTLTTISHSIDGAGYGGLPYLYPPLMARVLYPLSRLPYFPASFLWLVLKCLALESVLFSILTLLRVRFNVVSLFLIHLAALLYRPIGLDMSAGNIAILEAALILGALTAWRGSRYGPAGALMVLGGSLKGSSLLLTLYPLHLRDKPFLRALGCSAIALGALLLIDFPALLQCVRFFHSHEWQLLWDEQVQSFYNCSSTTVILRTFSETYFAEPLWNSPAITIALIPLFPISVFAAACFGIHRFKQRNPFNKTDSTVLSLLLCAVLLIPPRLAGYTLVWTLFPAVCIITTSFRQRHWGALTLSLIGIGLLQSSLPPNHIPPGISQLLIDKDFFGLFLLFLSNLSLCVTINTQDQST